MGSDRIKQGIASALAYRRGRQVPARHPGGAGQLAEERDPGVPFLRLLPPPLRQFRVDGQGGLLGQAQHLRVGLAGELGEDEPFGGR